MERVPKENASQDSANSKRTAQGKFAPDSPQGDLASRINNSPQMIAQRKKLQSLFGGTAQLQGVEDEMLQGKFHTAQRVEEEEPLQGKFETVQRVEEEEPLQGKFAAVQRVEEEEPLQGKFSPAASAQLKEETAAKPNNTGLPDNLKSGIESLSGLSMDNVKVHYNSSRPAQLNALAYAQGSDIHVAPGQERHLPHEAWHVVQQAQGRVQPTRQMKDGVAVNDDAGLEREADVMGETALRIQLSDGLNVCQYEKLLNKVEHNPIQRTVAEDIDESLGAISNCNGYTEKVLESVVDYKDKILEVSAWEHLDYQNVALDLAQGLKGWSTNYYNKSQAYLYEMQKANDSTNLGQYQARLAVLGVDTDTQPDITIYAANISQQTSKPSWTETIAHELKASTSPRFEAVDALVNEGLNQLYKREQNGEPTYHVGYTKLILTIHNDNENNPYPFTSKMVEAEFGDNISAITPDDVSERMKTCIGKKIETKGISLPIDIRLEHNGANYGYLQYNVSAHSEIEVE